MAKEPCSVAASSAGERHSVTPRVELVYERKDFQEFQICKRIIVLGGHPMIETVDGSQRGIQRSCARGKAGGNPFTDSLSNSGDIPALPPGMFFGKLYSRMARRPFGPNKGEATNETLPTNPTVSLEP